MAKQTIGIGTNPNDGSGDPLRTAGTKINDNFSEIYSALGDGATLLNGDIDFGSNNLKYQSKYLNVSSLPTASAYGGMTAKVDSDNKLYFSDGTNWVKLSSGTEAFDGNYNNLTNKPSLFTGNYNDLTNKPTVPTSIGDLVTDGSAGQVLTTNGAGLFTFSAINFPNQNLYQSVAGDSGSGSASTPTDTLTIAGGTNITTQMVGSTLTVNSSITALSQLTNDLTSFDGDITGSIFGDDSTLLVDAVNNKFPGITSSDLDMGGNKVLFANVYSNLVDLPSASTYHGMFAHVHATGKGYFAHAGAWIPLANESDIPVDISDLTDVSNLLSGGGGGSAFTNIGIGADDSTIRSISEGESFKIIGGTGVTTASDAEGNITITGFDGSFGDSATPGTDNTLSFGADNDLQIYHKTSDGHNYMQLNDKRLYIKAVDDGITGPQIIFDHETTTPSTVDFSTVLTGTSRDSAGATQTIGQISYGTPNVTSGSFRGSIRFDVTDSNGTVEYVRLDGNNDRIDFKKAVRFSEAFTFPTSDGSPNQVLQTNGSGVVTWATVSGSGLADLVDDTTPELGGDLVTGANRITFADTGTVSFMDFTVTQFGENNHTVLSSVKSINFFLDANGGDTGEAFRIYNNTNPDSSPTENTYIFKVSENGDVNVTGKVLLPDGSVSANYAGFGDNDDLKIFHNGNHSIVRETGTGNLYLQSNDNVIMSKDSDTALMVKGIADGAVELYHNAIKKFETTATGALVTGNLNITNGVNETFVTLTGATGTVAHDCATAHIFYHTGASANFTANFTNLTLAQEDATNIAIIINQGGTGYIPNAVQIGGSAQTIIWQGNSAPTATDNGTDTFSFTILNDGGTYVVLGQMVSFGGV